MYEKDSVELFLWGMIGVVYAMTFILIIICMPTISGGFKAISNILSLGM